MFPYLIFSDKSGKIYSHPTLRMAVSSLDKFSLPQKKELLKLPQGSTYFYLPQRAPVGFNPKTKKFEVLSEFKRKKVYAVGAFLVPAYLRLYNPAVCIKKRKVLPLWAYTACGFYANNFYVTAKKVDCRRRQSPRFYDHGKISQAAKDFLKRCPKNRLYRHLANCALNYNCLAAKNLFLERWEAPIPTARTCNARCLGCLSSQESDCIPSHGRINFRPRVNEVVEVMINHLKKAKEPIVSFGQGCEGEPLLEASLIARSIFLAREKVFRGTININTNASVPHKIKMLCEAGADSFRVSLNSPVDTFYNLYFRPRGYKFKDVLESIAIAKRYKKFVSINLFVLPGFSDSEDQIKALTKFIKNTAIDMIQWRNLNIDPQYYLERIPAEGINPKGILRLVDAVKREFPHLKMGYFNLPKNEFRTWENVV